MESEKMMERSSIGELKNIAYTKIKENIINCVYPPGAMLSEQLLTEELMFSRTPIREALNRIEQEGFVRMVPKKGVIVAEVSINDIVQIFGVREELEPIIVKLAGPNLKEEVLVSFQKTFQKPTSPSEKPSVASVDLDMEMHEYLSSNCNNRYFSELMQRVYSHNKRIVIATKQQEGVRIHDARQEHLDIINLLLDKDFEKAQEAMRIHIRNCKEAAFHHFMAGFAPY